MLKHSPLYGVLLLALAAAPAANSIDIAHSLPVLVPLANDSPAFLFQDENGKFYYQDTDAEYTPYSQDNKEHSWRVFSAVTLDALYADYYRGLTAFLRRQPEATAAEIYHHVERPLYSPAAVRNTTGLCDRSPLTRAIMPPLLADGKAVSGYDYNNYCGLMGVWVDPDSGDWYGPVHDELFGNKPRFDAIELAVSKDKGKNWTIVGPIITSPYSIIGTLGADGKTTGKIGFPQQTYHYGGGDPRLFVDYASGYFYLFYTSRIMNDTSRNRVKSGFNNTMWAHVARARIRDKMAPGSWEKYIDGRWDASGNKMQPYGLISNNGPEANLVPVETDADGYDKQRYDPLKTGTTSEQGFVGSALKVINISWNSYLGRYIGTPEHRRGENNDLPAPLTFYATADLSTQKWYKLAALPDYQNASWYRFMVDDGSASQQAVTGKTFRSYCYYYCSKGGENGGEYITITLKTRMPYQPVAASGIWRITNRRHEALGSRRLRPGGSGGWRLQPTGDGFYRLIPAEESDKALSVYAKDRTIEQMRRWGAPVRLAPLDTAAAAPQHLASLAQQWQIQQVVATAADGKNVPTPYLRAINRISGLALSFSPSPEGGAATTPQRDWPCRAASCLDKRPPEWQLLTLTPM